jgi:pilus assembly protein CpaE
MSPDRSTPTPPRSVTPTTAVGAASEPGIGRGTVVAVFGARSDVGVTSIATSLAFSLMALSTGEVALAELDPRARRARTTAHRDRPPAPPEENGHGDHPPHANRVTIPGIDNAMERRSDGLWTLSHAGTRTPALTDAKSVTIALEVLRSTFAISIAELEHQMNERTLAAFDAADRILIVTDGSVPSLRATQRVLRLCRRLNYPDEKMAVVVNRYDAADAIPLADISTILKREIYWRIPDAAERDVTGLAEKVMMG